MDGDKCGIDLVMTFPKKMNMCVKGYVERYLRDTRLKPAHLLLIHNIGLMDGTSQRGLNDEVLFDKSYISNMVHELIDMGLVTNDGSGKTHILRLTDSGRDIFAMSQMMFELIDRDLFSVLSDEEKLMLDTLMRKLDGRVNEILDNLSKG